MTPKIGGSEYPEEVLNAFVAKLPFTAQRLGDYVSGKTSNPRSKHMLDAFYEGWKAREDLIT